MLSLSILASSSKANCCLVESAKTRILIDAGLGKKETYARLAAIKVDPESLTAIVISHEHGDHARGIPPMIKALHIPVYTTELTAPFLKLRDGDTVEYFRPGTPFVIGDIDITPFDIPHDAAEPVGFTLSSQGIKLTIVTDLGHVPERLAGNLADSDLLMLEMNHDLAMLKVGPYPWEVKERVAGRNGHLSNEVAAQFVQDYMSGRTSALIGAHLSEGNNHPELVRVAGNKAVEGRETQFFLAQETITGRFTY